MQFSELGLSPKVLAAVEAAGYTTPTPIQEQAIPHVLQRRDVLGIAQTGTGKTAGFVLPMLTLVEKGRARARMPRTLILEPTRELAAQVEENFNKYGVNHKLNVALLIGGVSFDEQMKKLDRGADVLIATPGRLLDLFERGRILMNGVEILVIDEADRMLDMGFIPDIERITKLVPFTRQTLFFSATMPSEIKKLADNFLHNPVQVAVATASSTAETVTQRLARSGKKDFEKRAVLRELLNEAVDLKNAIVFCNRKRDVATLLRSLVSHEYSAGALHGDMDQRSRMQMLSDFREGKVKILVASDVAARGLDIPDVSHVYNYDVPIHAEDYIHRIGRTGRAGREGTAITIVTAADTKYLSAIEGLIKTKIEWIGESPANAEPIAAEPIADVEKPRKPPRKNTRRKSAKSDQITDESQNEESASESIDNSDQPEAAIEADAPSEPGDAKRGSGRNRTRGKKPQNQIEEPVISKDRGSKGAAGMGDHVPAFMLRQVLPERKAS